MVQLQEQLMSPPALPWCCPAKYKTHPSAPRTIVLKDALGIKDVEILSVRDQRFTGQNCSRKATAKQELKPKTSLIIQNSLWDGRSEAMLLGWSRCTAHLRRFLFQEQGSLEGFSCPSILPQFLAHRQPLLEMVPYIYNEDIFSHFSTTFSS